MRRSTCSSSSASAEAIQRSECCTSHWRCSARAEGRAAGALSARHPACHHQRPGDRTAARQHWRPRLPRSASASQCPDRDAPRPPALSLSFSSWKLASMRRVPRIQDGSSVPPSCDPGGDAHFGH